ncbi:MAG TPA: sulfur carrier protein ThiS [Acidobacteriaceae bacterium]|nr:sulfur carrier protein ThiS [Acidobacteriaceae bacterium]
MKLYINGQEREFADLDAKPVLTHLITLLAMKADRIAVEHNGEIAPRSAWEQVALQSGDKLEIVQFVGGGE